MLADSLLEYGCYYQPLTEALLNDYPVEWNPNSDIYKSALALSNKVNTNLALLTNSNPLFGPI